MKFIRFQKSNWAMPLVLEWNSWDSVWKTLSKPLVLHWNSWGSTWETLSKPLVLEWNSWDTVPEALAKPLVYIGAHETRLEKLQKTLLLQWISWDPTFRNFKKTIDFALEFMRLNLRNSNTTMAFSLELIGFNMRNLKEFISLTLGFIGFNMGNVKNRLVLHWNSWVSFWRCLKQVGSSLELMRFSMRSLNSMIGFTMEFIRFQKSNWAMPLVLEWNSWDSVWKTLSTPLLLYWNSWDSTWETLSKPLVLEWNSWDSVSEALAKPLVLHWSSWNSTWEIAKKHCFYNGIHETQIEKPQQNHWFYTRLGLGGNHFIKLQSHTTTSKILWIKRERARSIKSKRPGGLY